MTRRLLALLGIGTAVAVYRRLDRYSEAAADASDRGRGESLRRYRDRVLDAALDDIDIDWNDAPGSTEAPRRAA